MSRDLARGDFEGVGVLEHCQILGWQVSMSRIQVSGVRKKKHGS
jgi:hypothetical protein